MTLSIVLPIFEAPEDVVPDFPDLLERVERQYDPAELIIVDDGSRVRPVPPEVARRPGIRLLRLPTNQGKGAALRRGMALAMGKYRLFMDGDLPYSVTSVVRIVTALEDGADIAIGDRTLESSTAAKQVSWRRAVLSRIVSALVARPLTNGLPDTQCGLKGFRSEVADRLFPISRCRRFLIDVELLHAALRNGLIIDRVPVHQERFEPSTIRIWRELFPTVIDFAGLLLRSWLGHLQIGSALIGQASLRRKGEEDEADDSAARESSRRTSSMGSSPVSN